MKLTFERRLAGDFSWKVNTQQRIDVEIVEGEIEIGRKIVLQADAALHGEIGFIEVGVRGELEFAALGDGVEIEISRALLVEGQVFEMEVGLDRWLLEGAAGAQREVGDSIGGEAAGLKARKMGKIEVSSGKIELKFGLRQRAWGGEAVGNSEVRCTDGGATGERGVEDSRFDVVELKLLIDKAQVTFQQRDGNAIDGSVAYFEMSVAVGMGERAGDGCRDVERTGEGLGRASPLRNFGCVGVA